MNRGASICAPLLSARRTTEGGHLIGGPNLPLHWGPSGASYSPHTMREMACCLPPEDKEGDLYGFQHTTRCTDTTDALISLWPFGPLAFWPPSLARRPQGHPGGPRNTKILGRRGCRISHRLRLQGAPHTFIGGPQSKREAKFVILRT